MVGAPPLVNVGMKIADGNRERGFELGGPGGSIGAFG